MKLIAKNPAELKVAHDVMVRWCERKLHDTQLAVAEADEAVEYARRHKWKTSSLERIAKRERARIVFYEKIKAALEAGYYIIPNFHMDVFAIRTDAKRPRKARGGRYDDRTPTPKLLPQGEGRHVAGTVDIEHRPDPEDEKDKWCSWESTDFRDVEFPIDLAKPELMQRTGEALALKLFDEIGVARDYVAHGDPIVVGRLRNPVPRRPAVCFFIGWYLDTERI